METYLFYIGKVALAAGAFYIAFLLLFQNQKHFMFNRIYLPVSLLLSFGIPLITFTTVQYIETAKFDVNSFAYLAGSSENPAQPVFVLEWFHYLLGIYILGAAGFLFYLLLGHLKAIHIVRKSRVQQLFKSWVNITKKDVHPFSFFRKIVLSEKTLDNPALEMIVEHENIHVKEKHTLDILFTEILFLLQWFNPFAWLIKDAVKNNLEYLTDHEISKNHDPQKYQLAMVGLADKEGVAPFLNALNGSQLKNRIIMMKKKTENRYAFLKQLAVLPLLAILVMGLSNKEVRTEIVQSQKTDNLKGNPIIHIINSNNVIKGKITDRITQNPVSGAKILLEEMAIETGSDENGNYEIEFGKNEKPVVINFSANEYETNRVVYYGNNENININLDKIDNSKQQKIIKGKVTNERDEPLHEAAILLKGTTTGTITDPNGNFMLEVEEVPATIVISMPDYDKTEVTLDGINEFKIQLKKDGVPHSFEIKSNQKNYLKTVKGKISDEKGNPLNAVSVIIKGKTVGTITDPSGKFEIGLENENETLVFAMPGFEKQEIKVDGKKEIIVKLKADKNAKPDEIKVTDYGMQIRPTNTIKSANNNVVEFDFGSFKDVPAGTSLYIVDGVESENIENINPDDIASIDVLKNESATALYGEKGKNGVILIRTKNQVKIKSENPERNPLVIVDGKEFSSVEAANVKPEEIASVNVIKNEEYTKMYGEKAKDGVIVINTKTKYNSEPTDLVTIHHTKNKEGEPIFYKVEEMPEFPGGESALKNFIAKSLKYPEIALDNGIIGTVYVSFTITKEGKVTNPKLSRGIDPNLDNEALRVISLLPNWKPGKQNGNPVNVSYTVPVYFNLDSSVRRTKSKTVITPSQNPLFVINGIESQKSIEDIDPETIESVNILKDEKAAEKYGVKGKKGVIEITLKKAGTSNEITSILDLRKFFAGKIKYPVAAQEVNGVGTVEIWAFIDNDGKLGHITTKKPDGKFVNIDEIVVTALKITEAKNDKTVDVSTLLQDEAKRVISLMPVVQVKELQGEMALFRIRFTLQD